MLLNKIQDRIKVCMKNGNTEERDTLRTVIGEAQKFNLSPTDEDIIKVLKKSKESSLEMLNLVIDGKEKIQKEIDLYDSLLPLTLSEVEIMDALKDFKEEIKNSRNMGQAIGFAMKHLKTNYPDKLVDGKIVSPVVKDLFEK